MNITPLEQWIARKIDAEKSWVSREAIDLYQINQIQRNIEYVKRNSPFYAKFLQGTKDDISTFIEFEKIPLTTAIDIENNPYNFLCVKPDEVNRIVTLPTSGTTDQPKRIFFSLSDQELTIDFFKIGMSTLTRSRDRILIFLPGNRLGSVADLLSKGLSLSGCESYICDPAWSESISLQFIKKTGIQILVGSPSQLHRLAIVDEKLKILPKHQIRAVLSSTDYLANAITFHLNRLWGCEVFDHFGMTETGLGGGVECEAHNGYHLREADLYFEIIDPATGKTLPDGEEGEIVVTTLTRTAMPLIRYKTGDQSKVLSEKCECGSIIKRLARINHRVGAGICLSDTSFYLSDLDEILFSIEGIVDYSAAFSNPGILQIAVNLIDTSDQSFLEKISSTIQCKLKKQLQGKRDLNVQVIEEPELHPLCQNRLIKRVISVN